MAKLNNMIDVLLDGGYTPEAVYDAMLERAAQKKQEEEKKAQKQKIMEEAEVELRQALNKYFCAHDMKVSEESISNIIKASSYGPEYLADLWRRILRY